MNSQASPAIATHVTGPNRYALVTKMAPMGAAERTQAPHDEGGGFDVDHGWVKTENVVITVQRGVGEEHGSAGVAG